MDRSDVDDLALTAYRLSTPDELPNTEKRPVEIGLDYLIEFSGGQFGYRLALAGSGIVYQDIGCTQLLVYSLEQSSNAIFIRYVQLLHQAAATRLLYLFKDLLRTLAVGPVGHGYISALTRENSGHGLAHAGVRSGDDDDFAGQLAHSILKASIWKCAGSVPFLLFVAWTQSR